MQAWDADRYDRQFGYVSSLGGGVLDLLDPRDGERVLDLGCGSGELALEIRGRGAHVVALDEPVDAVFSNAALHWMKSPDLVVRRVRAALRDGGRFVAELGGAGNCAVIIAAVRRALTECGLPATRELPWFFPSVATYSALLEEHGFRVAVMHHFARATELTHCPNGVADWVAMFGTGLLDVVPDALRPEVLERVNELCRPQLFDDGRWYADYVRLRFVAIAEDAIGFSRP